MTSITDDATLPAESVSPVSDITRKVKVGWASGALGVAILMNSISGLAMFYMISVLHINPLLAGLLITASKFFDLATDPVVGRWSDSVRTGKSRRRPVLFWGAIVSAGSFAMIFTTPLFEAEWARAAYVFGAMLVYTLGYTIFNVPYMSMPSEMTDDYHERSSIHSYRMMFISVAGLIAGALTPWILEQMGRLEWSSYAIIGGGGGVIILLSMLNAWRTTANAKFTEAGDHMPNIFDEIGHVFANRHFIRLIAVKAAQLIGIASASAAGMFFLLNVLQKDLNLMALTGLVVGPMSLLFAPVVVWISKRIGKSRTYMLAAANYVIITATWMLADANEPDWAYLLRMALVSFSASGNIIMAMSMLTDIINQDAKKTGIRREGVYTAFYSFTEKFTFALGPTIVGVALAWAGFDQNLPPEAMQTPEIRQALLLGNCYIPVAMGFLAIFLLSGYKLKEEDLKNE